jgi:hypothetical protein
LFSKHLHLFIRIDVAVLCLALFVLGLYFATYTTKAEMDAHLAASVTVQITPGETFKLNFTVDYSHLKPLVSKTIKVEGLFERSNWFQETEMEIADSIAVWDRPFLMFKFSSHTGMELENTIFGPHEEILLREFTNVSYGGGPILRIPQIYEANKLLKSGAYRLEFSNLGNTAINGTLYSSLAATHFSRPHFSIGIGSIIISSTYPVLMLINRRRALFHGCFVLQYGHSSEAIGISLQHLTQFLRKLLGVPPTLS